MRIPRSVLARLRSLRHHGPPPGRPADRHTLDAATGTIVCDIPIERLVTEVGSRPAKWTPQWQELYERWGDGLALARLRPHHALMRHLTDPGSDPGPAEYLAWAASIHTTRGLRPPRSGDDILFDRERLHGALMHELRSHGSILEPLEGHLIENGAIALRDGHHRASFAYTQGVRFLPIRLSVEDYAKVDDPALQAAVFREIARQKRAEFYTPLPIPWGAALAPLRDGHHPTRLEIILEHFSDARFAGKSILDIGSNLGYYSQHFTREKARVTGLEPDARHRRLAELVMRASGSPYDLRGDRVEDADIAPHEIGVMLTVLYHYMGDLRMRSQIAAALERNVTSMLIWESGHDPEAEKAFLLGQGGFADYTFLARTQGTAKQREMGIFRR